jgi:hypothetical protein
MDFVTCEHCQGTGEVPKKLNHTPLHIGVAAASVVLWLLMVFDAFVFAALRWVGVV